MSIVCILPWFVLKKLIDYTLQNVKTFEFIVWFFIYLKLGAHTPFGAYSPFRDPKAEMLSEKYYGMSIYILPTKKFAGTRDLIHESPPPWPLQHGSPLYCLMHERDVGEPKAEFLKSAFIKNHRDYSNLSVIISHRVRCNPCTMYVMNSLHI